MDCGKLTQLFMCLRICTVLYSDLVIARKSGFEDLCCGSGGWRSWRD